MVNVREGHDGSKILAAMGIDIKRCRGAVVRFTAGKVVMIDAEMYAEVRDGDTLLTEIKRFKLVPVDEEDP